MKMARNQVKLLFIYFSRLCFFAVSKREKERETDRLSVKAERSVRAHHVITSYHHMTTHDCGGLRVGGPGSGWGVWGWGRGVSGSG